MLTILKSDAFDAWFDGLKDTVGRGRIADRIERMSEGNFGDHKSVGDGIFELRIAFGPGYRVYCLRHGASVVVLLAGGDKRSQDRDIKRAKQISRAWKETQP